MTIERLAHAWNDNPNNSRTLKLGLRGRTHKISQSVIKAIIDESNPTADATSYEKSQRLSLPRIESNKLDTSLATIGDKSSITQS